MPPLTMAVLCLQDKLMTTLNHQINELTKLTFQIIFHETDKQYNILIQVKRVLWLYCRTYKKFFNFTWLGKKTHASILSQKLKRFIPS